MRINRHRLSQIAFALLWLCAAPTRAADDFIDRLDDHLVLSAFHGNVSARISGLVDLDMYLVQQPAPGLIYTNNNFLIAPRLTLNLDTQIGPHFYVFVQARFDRGFDPADEYAEARLDQYALRFTPWDDGRFNVQIGKFVTAVARWPLRHDSWLNPFITAPLVYENVTHIYDTEAPESLADFLGPLDEPKIKYNPVIWGPSYATGAAAFGHIGPFDYDFEIKNAGLSSRPEYWDATRQNFNHPTFSGRLGWQPDEAWNFGVSGSAGPYFVEQAVPTLPPGKSIGDYWQYTIAQDASYAWHHWQLWAECFESRFEVPRVGNADTLGYYVEAKYKFTPQLFGALRWNQQIFEAISDGSGGSETWTPDIWRIDTALTYRFTPHLQAKLQYSYQRQQLATNPEDHLIAWQFTLRF